MDNELLKAKSAGLNQTPVEPLVYHSPKFASLGPIQSLVKGTPNPPTNDGGVDPDGTGSVP
jgi:hypothetical protein